MSNASVTFSAQTDTVCVAVMGTMDGQVEDNETVTLVLSSQDEAVEIATPTLLVTVEDQSQGEVSVSLHLFGCQYSYST